VRRQVRAIALLSLLRTLRSDLPPAKAVAGRHEASKKRRMPGARHHGLSISMAPLTEHLDFLELSGERKLTVSYGMYITTDNRPASSRGLYPKHGKPSLYTNLYKSGLFVLLLAPLTPLWCLIFALLLQLITLFFSLVYCRSVVLGWRVDCV